MSRKVDSPEVIFFCNVECHKARADRQSTFRAGFGVTVTVMSPGGWRLRGHLLPHVYPTAFGTVLVHRLDHYRFEVSVLLPYVRS